MAIHYGSRIVTDRLLSLYDPASGISYPTRPGRRTGALTEYVAGVGGVPLRWVRPYAGYQLRERLSYSTPTAGSIVGASTVPDSGTFNTIAGRSYFYDRPTFIYADGRHDALFPLNMAGKFFYFNVNRDAPSQINIFSPYDAITVNWYSNSATGINGTVTQSVNVASGAFGTISNVPLGDHYISVTGGSAVITINTGTSSGDRTVLSPASTVVYNRYKQSAKTIFGGTPATFEEYVSADSAPLMTQTIGDGSGGDTIQGLGAEYLSDTYAYGGVLSDYTLVIPNTNTITVSYSTGAGAWVVWDTHTVSGSSLAPIRITRDGTNGPGVEASTISGGSANMASGATIWKFEGTQPFFAAVNDPSDDEIALLGWMRNQSLTVSLSRNDALLRDPISGQNMTIFGDPFRDDRGFFTLESNTWNYLMRSSYPFPTTNVSVSVWFRSNFTQPAQTPFTYSVAGDNSMLLFLTSATTIQPNILNNNTYEITVPSMVGTWQNFVWTSNRNTGAENYYLNGALVGSRTHAAGTLFTSNGFLIVGQESDSPGGGFDANQNLDGNFGYLSVYSKVLSQAEVTRNFEALRGRFGR